MAHKISAIKKACEINDFAINEVLKNFSQFKTEKDISKFLAKQIKSKGAKLAFPIIVANGKNAYELHHKPMKKKLTKGFLLIDFGAKVDGYCSDMTRTFYLGKPNKKESMLYDLVADAQEACITACKPGVLGSDIDHLATKLLGRHSSDFIHAAGHGVDKKVHAYPRISARSPDKLKTNDVIAIELGIYLKNKLGIRIEDTLVVSKNPKVFTKFTKNLIMVLPQKSYAKHQQPLRR